MASFLVTGGCGFIGSHLTDRLLAGGHRVRVLDDLSTGHLENLAPEAEFFEGDVGDTDLLARAMAGVDGCFHLAAIASVERATRHWLATHRVNLSAAIAVLEAARDNGRIPVVYASSAAVYGDNQSLPLVETALKSPLSAYGADKLGCEMHAFVASRVHTVPTCGLRFFNVYGPRQDPASPYSGVISIFCDRIGRGRDIVVHGDGLQSRDFVFVRDVVEGLVLAMERADREARVYNICTGRPTSILDLARLIADILDAPLECRFDAAREGDIRHSLGSPLRARKALGFRARTALEAGLSATLERATEPLVPAIPAALGQGPSAPEHSARP